ncbi:MAG: hypothetical protein WB586_10015 [Chthoniobacterales bacterium]
MTSGPGREYDLNNIESICDVRPVQQAKPFFGCADDSLLLGEVDGLMRGAKQVCRPGLYLNEHENVSATVTANNVDFAASP